MRLFRHILCVFAAVMTLFSCSRDGVIPEDDFAEIYAEMLLVDQWVISTPRVRTMADTSLVYEPILNRYGYTSEDYRRSMKAYLEEPEEYAKIFEQTKKILEDRLAQLHVRREELERQKEYEKYLEQFKVDMDFRAAEKAPYLFKEPETLPIDSVSVVLDTTDMVYDIIITRHEPDTTYDGVRVIVKKQEEECQSED